MYLASHDIHTSQNLFLHYIKICIYNRPSIYPCLSSSKHTLTGFTVAAARRAARCARGRAVWGADVGLHHRDAHHARTSLARSWRWHGLRCLCHGLLWRGWHDNLLHLNVRTSGGRCGVAALWWGTRGAFLGGVGLRATACGWARCRCGRTGRASADSVHELSGVEWTNFSNLPLNALCLNNGIKFFLETSQWIFLCSLALSAVSTADLVAVSGAQLALESNSQSKLHLLFLV